MILGALSCVAHVLGGRPSIVTWWMSLAVVTSEISLAQAPFRSLGPGHAVPGGQLLEPRAGSRGKTRLQTGELIRAAVAGLCSRPPPPGPAFLPKQPWGCWRLTNQSPEVEQMARGPL